ncbi:MAG: hypothetical protein ACI9BW_000812 [Gammaproteobacteria bacterium]
MKVAAYISIAIIVGWIGMALAQLWFQPMSASLFIKISVTCGLGLTGAVLVSLIRREYSNGKALKEGKFID